MTDFDQQPLRGVEEGLDVAGTRVVCLGRRPTAGLEVLRPREVLAALP